MNETEYLLSSTKNAERLLESVNQIKQKAGHAMNKQFNVLQTNTQSVNRTELLSKLSKEEQIMFNKFVKSVNSK